MKRKDLLKHLKRHGCRLLREGKAHSIWENPVEKLRTPVPRHREINEYLAHGICEQLGVPRPSS
jgi:hypothetical protein